MAEATSPTYWARIHIAGPIETAKQIIRRECMRKGLCVTITPTSYIYTGGEEVGYVVELINYPRFPSQTADISERARALALMLRDETFQHSVLVQEPSNTTWYSTRDQ